MRANLFHYLPSCCPQTHYCMTFDVVVISAKDAVRYMLYSNDTLLAALQGVLWGVRFRLRRKKKIKPWMSAASG